MRTQTEIDRGVIQNGATWKTPLAIGTCTLGQVRFEWAAACAHMVTPVNLSMVSIAQPYALLAPMRYHVAEAQNILVKDFLSNAQLEWLFLLEDDVVPTPNILLQWTKWMNLNKYPVISGWYNVKAKPPIPMFFRGRGNGPVFSHPDDVVGEPIPYGEKLELEGVMCDGVPTGCMLIARKFLEVAWDNSPELKLTRYAGADGARTEIITREVFLTQREAGIDPETGGYYKRMGTSDLEFCDRAMQNDWFSKSGYGHLSNVEWPYPVDTDLECGHIDLTTGFIY